MNEEFLNEEGGEEDEIKLEKIPLEKFIKVLVNLFNKGIEYIDIIGIHDIEEDYVGVSVRKEYLPKHLRDKFDEIMNADDEEQQNDNLTDLI